MLVVQASEGLPALREVESASGACGSFRILPEQAHPELGEWLRRAAEELGAAAAGTGPAHGALYLDLETLGFAGVQLFLVGMLHAGAEGFHVHQFLARDYSEEATVLEVCRPLLEQAECLVTYNGRTFDWPFLTSRYRYHRLPPPVAPAHLDLLPLARRLYSGRLPNCSLGTIEEHVLGLQRVGDVPGGAIPDLYHRAVAEENAQVLAPVLYHNQVDLLSLACLAGRWAEKIA
jgi:uncharacterized protein YprB with RNaseH-like and TPR domain